MQEFKFCWGEPYCIREALKDYYKKKMIKAPNIDDVHYQSYEGHPLLVENTRQFLKEITDIDYKYIMITNGTTSALNIVLRSLKKKNGYKKCFTHKYYFPFYPDIVEKNGYEHATGLYQQHESQLSEIKSLAIVDSPSNPLGDLLLYTDIYDNVVWDSVYHNPVFINTIPVKPDHRVNCGSYSKVFGLTGARIGWVATNNEKDFEFYMKENMHENCSVSYLSQNFLLDILQTVDVDLFMRSAQYRVNNNREYFDKICYLFDGQSVPENGMFYAAWASPYTSKLLDKLNIKSVEMDKSGRDRFLRFNLAQTNELTKKAIRYIIKEDGK